MRSRSIILYLLATLLTNLILGANATIVLWMVKYTVTNSNRQVYAWAGYTQITAAITEQQLVQYAKDAAWEMKRQYDALPVKPTNGMPTAMSAFWAGGGRVYFHSSIKGARADTAAVNYITENRVTQEMSNAFASCGATADHSNNANCAEILVLNSWASANGDLSITTLQTKMIVTVGFTWDQSWVYVKAPCTGDGETGWGCENLVTYFGLTVCRYGRRRRGLEGLGLPFEPESEALPLPEVQHVDLGSRIGAPTVRHAGAFVRQAREALGKRQTKPKKGASGGSTGGDTQKPVAGGAAGSGGTKEQKKTMPKDTGYKTIKVTKKPMPSFKTKPANWQPMWGVDNPKPKKKQTKAEEAALVLGACSAGAGAGAATGADALKCPAGQEPKMQKQAASGLMKPVLKKDAKTGKMVPVCIKATGTGKVEPGKPKAGGGAAAASTCKAPKKMVGGVCK